MPKTWPYYPSAKATIKTHWFIRPGKVSDLTVLCQSAFIDMQISINAFTALAVFLRSFSSWKMKVLALSKIRLYISALIIPSILTSWNAWQSPPCFTCVFDECSHSLFTSPLISSVHTYYDLNYYSIWSVATDFQSSTYVIRHISAAPTCFPFLRMASWQPQIHWEYFWWGFSEH